MTARYCVVVLFCISLLVVYSFGSGIPIWELLQYQEKLGRLLYIFVQLVEICCKNIEIQDCRRSVIMNGVSNLLNATEEQLDLLDPYQKNSYRFIWEAGTKSVYECSKISIKNGSRILFDALYAIAGFDE